MLLSLTLTEEEALLRLQTLFPPEQTAEYLSLCEKSDSETLSETERERLLNLIEIRDHQNAMRLTLVAELAEMRGVSVREMMTQLEIRPV